MFLSFVLNEIFEISIAIYYFNLILNKKLIGRAQKIIVLVFCSVFGIVFINSHAIIITLTSIVRYFLICIILYETKKLDSIWITLRFVLIGIVSESVATVILTYITSEDLSAALEDNTIRFLANVASKIILIIIIKIIFLNFKSKYKKFCVRNSLRDMIVPAISIINIYLILYLQFETEATTILLTISLSMAVGLLVINFLELKIVNYRSLVEYQEKIIEQERQINSANQEIENQQKESIQNLRMLTHDFKNHIIALKEVNSNTLLYEEYHRTLLIELNKNLRFINDNFNNPILTNCLYRAYKNCNLQNIELITKLHVEDLSFIEPVDTNIIFSNLFDNAIYACNNIVNGDKWIKISSYKKEYFTIIEICNSHNNIIILNNDKIVTSKTNAEEHGNGLNIVKKAVKNNNGIMHVEFTDNVFIVSLVFSNKI